MKSSTLVVILLLQAVLVMGIPKEVKPYVPKCCDKCNSWLGALVCDDTSGGAASPLDDTMSKCHPECWNCVVMQEHPVKLYKCADAQAAGFVPCPPPCKKH